MKENDIFFLKSAVNRKSFEQCSKKIMQKLIFYNFAKNLYIF